jgi:hypothetical protein
LRVIDPGKSAALADHVGVDVVMDRPAGSRRSGLQAFLDDLGFEWLGYDLRWLMEILAIRAMAEFGR